MSALLAELSRGHGVALDRVLPLVYDELRRLARLHLRRERPHHTLDSTALIHEAYLRLVDIRQTEWRDRQHFVAVASRIMRRVLIDHARTRGRGKRGAGAVHVSLSDALGSSALPADELVALDETLDRLERLSDRACRVVECRCFGGLSIEETARALGVSPATVKREWAFSRAWLNRELGSAARS